MSRWSELKFIVVGGDRREAEAAAFLSRMGPEVRTYRVQSGTGLQEIRDLKEGLSWADVLLCPVSGIGSGGLTKGGGPDPLVLSPAGFRPGFLIVSGLTDGNWARQASAAGAIVRDFRERDDFALANAVPTAEGAIAAAMEMTDITLHGADVAVFGSGRIAWPLALKLKALSARVFLIARRPEALAQAAAFGLEPVDLRDAGDRLVTADVVFNTVPAMVLTQDRLARLPAAAVVIDLATAPGGTDFASASSLKLRAVLLPGLPGKVAPKTAGRIVAEVVRTTVLETPGFTG